MFWFKKRIIKYRKNEISISIHYMF